MCDVVHGGSYRAHYTADWPGPDNADVFPFRSDCGGDKDDMWTAAMNKLRIIGELR